MEWELHFPLSPHTGAPVVCMAEPSAQLPLSFPCALVVSASLAQHTYSSTTGGALFCRWKDKAPANLLASLPPVLLSKVLLLGQAMGI